jgi:ABC-type transport system involved in multi-copper enzyme maturation permease subunit
MCVAGLVLAGLTTALVIVSSSGFDDRLPQRVAGRLTGSTWIVATLWGAVVGSGIFASEFQPRLEQFWRSRPISPTVWFWVKFFGGLAAVLGVLDLVTILVGWDPSYSQGSDGMSYSYIACIPLLHALTYTLAVLAICWLRRPVLAAATAVVTFFMLDVVVGTIPGGAKFAPIHVYNALFFEETQASGFDQTRYHYPTVYGVILVIIISAALVAWRAALRSTAFERGTRV